MFFTTYASLTKFTIGFADPYYYVFMLYDMGMDYVTYSSLIIIDIIANMIFQRYWGRMMDKFGSKNIIKLCVLRLQYGDF